MLGFPILGLWYWCTDQTIVQRVLGADTLRDAQHGALFASLLKILPPFFMVLPGVLAYVLFRDIIVEPTDDLDSYHVSSDRLRRELGFEPSHTVEEAVSDLVATFRMI